MKDGHRGVTWEAQKNKWKVRVGKKCLGFFSDYEEAGAFAKKAREAMGIPEYNAGMKKEIIKHCDLIKTIESQAKIITDKSKILEEICILMDEVLRISDRDHDAWDAAKAAIASVKVGCGTSSVEEFLLVWFETTEEWVALLSNGHVLRGKWGAVGYARDAAMAYLGRGEAEFDVLDLGGDGPTYRYVKNDEYWQEGVAHTPES